ncbi:HNH endonuclease [Microbacterium sp. zg.B48]|uniref:HNH endonuclease signature motif containing protein n=1 Tax=Microbacterium sp. zg.B48 TaxID=2969408 RepID=UPI00214A8E83|nr:HNH endonuclease signature motif containing protein [Microbacterium sp. zg.B48]MCR2761974.1 HNH endonuclease [Microbacterium sp. zg.B48]
MNSPAIAAKERADARLATLLPQLADARREMARLQAVEAQLLADAQRIAADWAAEEDPAATSAAEFPYRSVAAEIGAVWRVSDRSVQRRLGEAAALVGGYRETLAALAAGEISAAHARIIVMAGTVIDRPELRAEFEGSVLEFAKTESASRLAPVAKRRAEWFAESTIDQRQRRARGQRRVWVTDLDDAMSEVHGIVPSVIAHGIRDRLTQLAHAVQDGRDPVGPADAVQPAGGGWGEAVPSRAEVDTRGVDELRADIFADLLLATDPTAHTGPTGLAAVHASVTVTVPVLTLIGDAVADPFEIGMLEGHSPIDAETARILTANAPGWDRVLTHPITGEVLAVDRYRPGEELRRHLRVRDQHCRFPGCRMPARRCDTDHTVDHATGGPTTAQNLAHLCRRHHSLKHHTAWRVRQRGGGVLEWTSPTGRTYTDIPVSTVAFAPDPECDLQPAPF